MSKMCMRRSGALLLSVSLLLTTLSFPVYGEDGGSGAEAVSGEYIVTSDYDLSGLRAEGPIEEVTCAGSTMALVKAAKGVSLSELEEALDESLPDYAVQPNYIYASAAARDPFYNVQWGLHNTDGGADVDFDRARSFVETNEGSMKETVVAVIDSGFDYTHEDLAANAWVNEAEIAGNGRDDDGNGYADDVYGYDFTADRPISASPTSREYAHGTHCAGTIGAVSGNGIGITGIGSVTGKVSLMNLKVLAGREGTGSTFDLIRAIEYAQDNGADICNLSMGSYVDDEALYQVIAKSDMLFVCAAGNDGLNLNYTPIYPGCYELDNVICVGNMRASGSLYRLSNFSSRYVDIAAPGTGIYSTTPANTYASMTGTSMAAPFVSGAAALLHSYYNQISAADMKGVLTEQAEKRQALSGKVAGKRSLNIYRALSAYPVDAFEPDETAPVIEASVAPVEGSYKQRLTVKVTDDSGKKPVVKYVRGDKDEAFFRKGNGYKVTLDDENTGTKIMGVPSAYTIYAADGAGNEAIYQVQCTADATNSIKLNYKNRTLRKGYYFNLRATLSKSGTYGRKLTYTSSNKNIARVTSSGRVWGKKKGTVTITVKTDNLLTAKCKVRVK